MTTRMMMVILCVTATVAVAAGQQGTRAEQIVADYLSRPYPQEEQFGETRLQRLEVLRRLGTVADEAAEAVAQALPRVSDARRRGELAEALGQYVQTPAAAKVLCDLLGDPDDHVRWQATHALRMLSRQTDRTGGARIQREPATLSGPDRERQVREALQSRQPRPRRRTVEPKDERTESLVEFAPKVEGLIPYLIEAADDNVEANRICALYALADSRDPAAVAELRNRLGDPSQQVRFYAACFLTEYQDTSGLDILLEALDRLQAEDLQANREREFEYFGDVERLVASFERITGKSFGAIPMNPTLSSSTVDMPVLAEQHMALLATWAQWWAWQPPTGS